MRKYNFFIPFILIIMCFVMLIGCGKENSKSSRNTDTTYNKNKKIAEEIVEEYEKYSDGKSFDEPLNKTTFPHYIIMQINTVICKEFKDRNANIQFIIDYYDSEEEAYQKFKETVEFWSDRGSETVALIDNSANTDKGNNVYFRNNDFYSSTITIQYKNMIIDRDAPMFFGDYDIDFEKVAKEISELDFSYAEELEKQRNKRD